MPYHNLPYRITKRLKGWDYRNPGLYFVTICTKDKEPFFGEIRDGMMGLSVPGCMAWYYWREIPRHQTQVVLDAFVVMPNHVHGIVAITSGNTITPNITDVRTLHATSVQMAKFKRNSNNEPNAMSNISPKSGSLSAIIRSYKSAVTRWCRQNGHEYFEWQSRFYDHIIRNAKSLKYIREYIFDNPMHWEADQEHPDRVHDWIMKYVAE